MNLETKRNAIMNAIASGQLTNLLANTTWNNGYFGSNGAISPAGGSTNEKYESEYINVDTTKTYVILINSANNIANWCGVATYNSENVFQSRPTFNGIASVFTPTMPKVRVSFRTYGNAQILMCEEEEYARFVSNNGIQV